MRPNTLGGISFEGDEVSAVLLCVGQTDLDVEAMRKEGFVTAEDRNVQLRSQHLANVYGLSMNDPYDRHDIIKQAKADCAVGVGRHIFEDALHLGPATTRIAIGAMLQAEQDRLIPKETRQTVRAMLIEQGLIKRTLKEKISHAATYLCWE